MVVVGVFPTGGRGSGGCSGQPKTSFAFPYTRMQSTKLTPEGSPLGPTDGVRRGEQGKEERRVKWGGSPPLSPGIYGYVSWEVICGFPR